MNEFRHIIIVIIISAIIGGGVSLPIAFIEQDSLLTVCLKGAGAGAVIGFAARFAFIRIYADCGQLS